eukprot:gene17259-18984_t
MAILKRKRLRILLLISICFNTSFVVIQFLLHHKDKTMESRIEIYQRVEGRPVGTRNLKDKTSLLDYNKLENESFNVVSDKREKDSHKLEINRIDTNDVNLKLFASELDKNRGVFKKAVRKVPENACPEGGEGLVGQTKVSIPLLKKKSSMLDELSVTHGGLVNTGGWWKPKHCTSRAKVAIMIPFRNREQQLKIFLQHMHPILQRQLLDYRVFVIEQVGTTQFNKGAIYNIGFRQTLNVSDYDCYIFHDVDLLSENDLNFYGCVDTPRHMSPAIDTLNYKLPYPTIFGGVEALSKDEFEAINGFSNIYWGWGGEDDDLYTRVAYKAMKLSRPSLKVGRYTMNHHEHFRSDSKNLDNERMYRDAKRRLQRIEYDGLNSLDKLKFNKVVTEELLFTRIAIDLRK